MRIVIRELQDAPRLLQEWDLLEPTNGGFQFRVELLRHWLKDYKSLQRVQEELDRIEPVAENLFQAAKGMFQGQHVETAFIYAQQSVNLNPNHIGANELLGDILISKGNWDGAYTILKKLYKFYPRAAKNRLVQVLLEIAQVKKDENDKLNIYEEILEIDVNNAQAKYKKDEIELKWAFREIDEVTHEASILEKNKNYQDALSKLQKLLNKFPNLYDGYDDVSRLQSKLDLLVKYDKAKTFLELKKYDEAQKLFGEIISLEPTYEDAAQLLIKAICKKDIFNELENEKNLTKNLRNKIKEFNIACRHKDHEMEELRKLVDFDLLSEMLDLKK